MKIKRRSRADGGPRFTISTPAGDREAKYGGEHLALTEALNEAEGANEPCVVKVLDEDRLLYAIERDERRNIRVTIGEEANSVRR
jgi:hypothetical protein